MPLIYRGSKKLTWAQMNDNFDYINNTKIEVSGPTGAAFIPPHNASDPGNILQNGSFTYGGDNTFYFYSNSAWRPILRRGTTGAAGAIAPGTGVTGERGALGYPGNAGSMGGPGIQGEAGPIGATGPRGPDGDPFPYPGPTGPQGPQGGTGPAGNRGPTGPAGPAATLTAEYLKKNVNNPGYISYADTDTPTPGIGSYRAYYGFGAGASNGTRANNLSISLRNTNNYPLHLNRMSEGAWIYTSKSLDGYASENVFAMEAWSTTNFTCGSPSSLAIQYDNLSSDYRLKENIVEVTKGKLELINKIKIYSYNMVGNPDNITRCGALAHELAEIFPLAVEGEKDAVNEKNEPINQTVNYAELIPSLTLAIKELAEQIEELESIVNNS